MLMFVLLLKFMLVFTFMFAAVYVYAAVFAYVSDCLPPSFDVIFMLLFMSMLMLF